MKRRNAIAEDLRKLGSGMMLAGVVGSALQDQVPLSGAAVVGVLGLVLVGAGVLVTPEEQL